MSVNLVVGLILLIGPGRALIGLHPASRSATSVT